MDENKLEKLREIKYKIPICCGLCGFGNFKESADWGTCGLWRYEHQKHSGPNRYLSVSRYGTCSLAKKKEKALWFLGKFQEFVKGR